MGSNKLYTVVDIKKCARCGQDHDKMSFLKFTKPPLESHYTHFCICPQTLEPVLMRIEKKHE
jgi:hypothetical protein